MSELWSKYLSMTSCLDWCSCAIRFFMYHSLGCLPASLAGEGLPCQCSWNTEKEERLSRAGPEMQCCPKMSLWLWSVLMNRLAEVIHLIRCRFFKMCPFRHVDQFWVWITGRLKAGDWYHVNPARLHALSEPSAEVRLYPKPHWELLQLMSPADLAGELPQKLFAGSSGWLKSASSLANRKIHTIIIHALFAFDTVEGSLCIYHSIQKSPMFA